MKPADGRWHLVTDGEELDMTLTISGNDADSIPGPWQYDEEGDAWIGTNISCAITFWEKNPPVPGPPQQLNFSAVRTYPNAVPPRPSETFIGTATKV